jgi:hypothetical protein
MQKELMTFLDARRSLTPNQQFDIGYTGALTTITSQERNSLQLEIFRSPPRFALPVPTTAATLP